MKKSGVEAMTEEELEKILLIGRIKHYEYGTEHDYLIDNYISTGKIPSEKEILIKSDFNLTNAVVKSAQAMFQSI